MLPIADHGVYRELRWSGLAAVAGQEVAFVVANPRWTKPTRTLAEFRQLLELRPLTAKWHGVWLLLSRRDVVAWALETYSEHSCRKIDLAVRDAAWVLHSLSWAWYADDATLAWADWLDARPEVRPLNSVARMPGNDHGRIDKSIRLLQAALHAAAREQRSMRWGSMRFDLTPLRASEAPGHVP